MKALSPIQSLVLLVLAGLAIAGWCYGLHWKRVVAGELFSSDELMMVRLQDQIDALSEENATLHEKLRSFSGEPVAPAETATPLTPVPVLPSGPQKIETH